MILSKPVAALLLPFLLLSPRLGAQSTERQHRIDSLRLLSESAKNDTMKVHALKQWDDLIYLSDPGTDTVILDKIITITKNNLDKNPASIQEKKFFQKMYLAALSSRSSVAIERSNYDQAEKLLRMTLAFALEVDNQEALSRVYSNFGIIYKTRGDFKTASEYYSKALKIDEETNNKKAVASDLNNIAILYADQEDKVKALEYFQKSLALRREIGLPQGITTALNNLGNYYKNNQDGDMAMKCFNESLGLLEKTNDLRGMGQVLNYIASIQDEQGLDKESMENFMRSLELREKAGDRRGMVATLNNIGRHYAKTGDYKTAKSYSSRALALAKELQLVYEISLASKALYGYAKHEHDYKTALEMHEIYIQSRDSMLSEQNQKAVVKQQLQYQYEKQKAIDAKENEKELVLAGEKEQRQRIISYAVAGGLVLVILFAIFIVNRLRLTRRQKKLIEMQKMIVESKQKEILDSITYAKRLQDAILPPVQQIRQFLPESFLLYLPKDIVAGDFYWMEKKNDIIYIAAADCTGHGVPGALVSVVCSNALNRALLEFGQSEPGAILAKTSELVLETFSKSASEVKDGMDISLAAFNISSGELRWSGANNPLIIIEDGFVREIAADKQPIGKSENPKPFTTHQISLRRGSCFYLITDGYADQFGGDKGKKLKHKQLLQELLQVSPLPAKEQRESLFSFFMDWKGGLEQVDDVCILGIRY